MDNICIDFGTCNSVISYFGDNSNNSNSNNNKFVYNSANGDVLIPTTLYFIKQEIKPNMAFEDFIYKKHFFRFRL